MQTDELWKHMEATLLPVLGEGEAASVTRLVMEDLFNFRRGETARALTKDEQVLADRAIERIRAGEPVQYVTEIADFYGLQMKVTPAVLIPRPETEELVEWILHAHPAGSFLRVADLGTGSGCIPLALKSKRTMWTCEGWDISEDALEIARWNGDRLALEVQFGRGDILRDGHYLQQQFYDVVVSNPPYIPPSERALMGESTLRYEPEIALFAPEADPLQFYRHLSRAGQTTLVDGGQLYLEVNEFNSEAVVQLLEEDGYAEVERRRDLQGKWRMVRGTRRELP